MINKTNMIPQGTQRSRCQETILLFIFLSRNNNEDTLHLHNSSYFSK